MVRKKTLIIALCIVSVLGGCLYWLDRVAQRMMDHKVGRPANATVVGKESPKQRDDQSDDRQVYYTIDTDSFRGQLDPEIWQSIITAETERYERGKCAQQSRADGGMTEHEWAISSRCSTDG